MSKLISISDGYMSLIEYVKGASKVERTTETGYYEALYMKGDDFILETKPPLSKAKKLRIPANVIFDLAELIPALLYFERYLMPEITMLDGTEVIKIKKQERK